MMDLSVLDFAGNNERCINNICDTKIFRKLKSNSRNLFAPVECECSDSSFVLATLCLLCAAINLPVCLVSTRDSFYLPSAVRLRLLEIVCIRITVQAEDGIVCLHLVHEIHPKNKYRWTLLDKLNCNSVELLLAVPLLSFFAPVPNVRARYSIRPTFEPVPMFGKMHKAKQELPAVHHSEWKDQAWTNKINAWYSLGIEWIYKVNSKNFLSTRNI